VRQHVISEYEVAKHLNENYDPAKLNDDLFYRLAKKREGWFVQQYKYDEKTRLNTVLKEEMCWSLETHSFLPVTLLGSKSRSAYRPYFNVNSYFTVSERIPYYGYEGWPEDVIADFEGTKEDTTLEGLGRAYQALADGFLSKREGFGKPENLNKPLDERIRLFSENMDKAIAVFEKLREVNPNYSMLVGQPQTKVSNTYMAAWLDLNIAGKPDLAAKYIVPNLYDPLMLSFSSDILKSCPQNALLFTHGDNDTYPLYYLQQRDKLRPDVEIVNLSLLNATDVIKWYKTDRKLAMSLGVEDYNKNELEQIFLEGDYSSADSLSWTDFIAKLKQEIAVGKRIVMSKGRIAVPYTASNDPTIPDSLQGDIGFKLTSSYMLLGDLALADIIASNVNSRPVCMTGNILHVPGLLAYQFVQRAGHNRLIPENYYHSLENGITQCPIDATQFADYYLNKTTFDTLCTDKRASGFYVEMMRYDFSSAALLLAKTDKVKSQQLIAWYTKMFPRKSWPYSTSMYLFVKALQETDQTEKAKQVAAYIIEDELININKAKGEEADSDRQRLQSFCMMIAEFATNHQQPEWAAKMQQEAKRIESEGKKK
jgi:hypothetical protein